MSLYILYLLFLRQALAFHRFGYGEKITLWPKECNGANQSPVMIDTHKAIPLAIPALETTGFHDLLPRPIQVMNNGHSVDLKLINSDNIIIFGALLDSYYSVVGIHFHWGSSNNKGSEHQINRMSFPMEMHVVTRNMKYNSTDEALKHIDGLAVMGFFFHLRERGSSSLQPILDALDLLHLGGSNTYLYQSFTLASLLPSDTDTFYTYKGSLTTPPCAVAVTWIVFPDPLPISFSQISKFRKLSNGKGALTNNFRHIQKLGNRHVFVRERPTEVNSKGVNIYDSINSSNFWGLSVDDVETME